MEISLVFAVIGSDQPGLVERLAATVADHNGNWLESRMGVLAGQFAGVVLVSAPETDANELRSALLALDGDELHVIVETPSGTAASRIYRRFKLEAFGRDHPGIVREIAHALTKRAVNIAEMETERSTGAMSAEAIFRLYADIELPENVEVDDLRRALEVLAGDLMVEVELDEETEAKAR